MSAKTNRTDPQANGAQWEQDNDGEWQLRGSCGHVCDPREIDEKSGLCVNCEPFTAAEFRDRIANQLFQIPNTGGIQK